MTLRFAIAAAGLAGVVAATTSNAQPAESVNVDVAACLELETRSEQLACYEARVDETLRTRESGQSASAPASATSTSDRTSGAATSNDERRDSREPERAEPAATLFGSGSDTGTDEIVATIVRLREMEPDAFLIYLDNDQIWRQNRPRRYALQEGAEVELRSTKWGSSYRLTDPNLRGFIQVERVQ
jgi:hypothetical protein